MSLGDPSLPVTVFADEHDRREIYWVLKLANIEKGVVECSGKAAWSKSEPILHGRSGGRGAAGCLLQSNVLELDTGAFLEPNNGQVDPEWVSNDTPESMGARYLRNPSSSIKERIYVRQQTPRSCQYWVSRVRVDRKTRVFFCLCLIPPPPQHNKDRPLDHNSLTLTSAIYLIYVSAIPEPRRLFHLLITSLPVLSGKSSPRCVPAPPSVVLFAPHFPVRINESFYAIIVGHCYSSATVRVAVHPSNELSKNKNTTTWLGKQKIISHLAPVTATHSHSHKGTPSVRDGGGVCGEDFTFTLYTTLSP
ncbi:hypothetical protein J6590_027918 [Homalodisca vitripennis]|nr:hypothetical protein J6590_027918 [Homalodisca vitripennis]